MSCQELRNFVHQMTPDFWAGFHASLDCDKKSANNNSGNKTMEGVNTVVKNKFFLIREWAAARNLIKGSTPEKQMLKLAEEMGELAAALARGQRDKAVDGIGDMAVVLTILAAQLNADFEACVGIAYEEIKNRKGRMVDGVFVKDAE